MTSSSPRDREYDSLPIPRSKERLKLLLKNPADYISRLDWDDIEALLNNLSKADGLSQEDLDDMKDAPDWLIRLEQDALE